MKWFLKNKKNSKKDIIKKITRFPKKGNFQACQYFYAFMLELKEGGISLIDVGGKDFFRKNWRMIRRNYKNILLKIYDLFLNDKKEFNQLLIQLAPYIDSSEFMKWVAIPWFRFLTIKSLHDSNITKIKFDQIKQELICIVETRNAIDYVPFNDLIELKFQTEDFDPLNIKDLIRCVDNNPSIIFSIYPRFENGLLLIEIEYGCFINPNEDYELPNLSFKCLNVQIRNL